MFVLLLFTFIFAVLRSWVGYGHTHIIVIFYSNVQIFVTVGWHEANFICTVTFADHENLLFGQESKTYLLYKPSYGKLSGKKI